MEVFKDGWRNGGSSTNVPRSDAWKRGWFIRIGFIKCNETTTPGKEDRKRGQHILGGKSDRTATPLLGYSKRFLRTLPYYKLLWHFSFLYPKGARTASRGEAVVARHSDGPLLLTCRNRPPGPSASGEGVSWRYIRFRSASSNSTLLSAGTPSLAAHAGHPSIPGNNSRDLLYYHCKAFLLIIDLWVAN